MTQLSSREKTLATVVGLIVTIVVNVVLVNFFLKTNGRLTLDLASKTNELEAKKVLLAEKTIWEQRDVWLQSKLPKLTNEGSVGVQLLDQVKELAKKDTVLIENPAIGTVDRRTQAMAVTVNIETKSPWRELGAFLRDLQGPEQFIVLERVNIQKDASDATQMRGQLRIGKWFALK